MPKSKYPVLYVQNFTSNGGVHLDAYEIEHRRVFVGTEKLTDILDELYKLRELVEENNER
jgi:hypothetical protein